MARTSSTGRSSSVLFLLFFFGLAVTAFAFVDVQWTHWIITRTRQTSSSLDPRQLERLRQSILNVRVRCDNGGEYTGTGFVVKAGFVATAAHVLGDRQACGGSIRLVDFKGLEHSGDLAGVSAGDDLALLRISDTTLPALQLADAAMYESANEVVRLVTIGYPLEEADASSRDSASI